MPIVSSQKLQVTVALMLLIATLLTACQGDSTPAEHTTAALSIDEIDTQTADGRTLSIRRYTPGSEPNQCAVVFSHGYASKGASYDRILIPFANAGYEIHAPLHVDSTDHPDNGKYDPSQNTSLRIADVKATLSLAFNGRGEVERHCWIAVGHSFGGLIAQLFGGANLPGIETSDVISPQRVIALSPPGAFPGMIPAETFDSINTPMIVVTGTNDFVMTTEEGGWRDHLDSHEGAPEILSTAYAFDSIDHYFNGLYGRPVERALTPVDEALIALIIAFADEKAPPASIERFLLPLP